MTAAFVLGGVRTPVGRYGGVPAAARTLKLRLSAKPRLGHTQ
jgi:hypothetical protein